MPSRPLEGVRVVELAHVAAGPFAGMLLADLGADVVKVEPPTGDQMRGWPPFATSGDERFSHNFASVNRNKRSVVADLKDPSDLTRVRELVAVADVVVENYRPGVLDRLGLGYDTVSDGHPGLVYASISGYGLTSPYVNDGAYDVVIQGMSGLMSVTGDAGGGPVKAGVPVGDFAAGLYAAYTIAALLPQVGRTGQSVRVDVPMLDCLLGISALQTSEFWGSGREPSRLGTAHPRNAPYQGFAAADGDFTVAAGNDRLWAAVASVTGLDELVTDPRFVTQSDRVAHQLELAELLQERFAGEKREHWLTELRLLGVPCGPVNTFGEILADPHVEQTGLVDRVAMPVAGEVPTVVFPVRIEGQSSRLDRGAPSLGADDDVYAGVGGIMTLLLDRGSVWTVTLARPERANALSAEMVEALHGVLDETDVAPPEALVLRGNARHFAAGFDLTALELETDATLAHRFLRIGLLLERLSTAPYLTVAVADGAAIGAGADLVLACDARLVAPAVTLRFPGSAFGVVLGATRRALLEDYASLTTGTPDQLDDLLAEWLGWSDSVRARALADRPDHDADAELAALARSVAVPGLRARIAAYASSVSRRKSSGIPAIAGNPELVGHCSAPEVQESQQMLGSLQIAKDIA